MTSAEFLDLLPVAHRLVRRSTALWPWWLSMLAGCAGFGVALYLGFRWAFAKARE